MVKPEKPEEMPPLERGEITTDRAVDHCEVPGELAATCVNTAALACGVAADRAVDDRDESRKIFHAGTGVVADNTVGDRQHSETSRAISVSFLAIAGIPAFNWRCRPERVIDADATE